ncbi:MAG: DUF983 domain-containing protein [Gemmatimonadota bacterium]
MYEPLPPRPDFRRAPALLGRALGLKCPSCGQARLAISWFKFHETCPGCGLRIERGEHGYLVGTYMFNLIAAELIFAAGLVTVLVATWPNPPWQVLSWAGPLLTVAMPIILYPICRTVFLAFDLIFRPEQPEDYPLRTGHGVGADAR